MTIKPLKCDNCGQEGRPGGKEFNGGTYSSASYIISCKKCGSKIVLDSESMRDQLILSDNIFSRLYALSNHWEYGKAEYFAGNYVKVDFSRSFDIIPKVFLAPGEAFVYVEPHALAKDGMKILTSSLDWNGKELINKEMSVSWLAYGLIETDIIPPWYLLFYSAVNNSSNYLYKPALLDYAISFELFLAHFLRERINNSTSQKCTEYLLSHTWDIKVRCNKILELTTGCSFSKKGHDLEIK